MFRILDRYLLREIALPFAISLLVLTFVLVLPPILTQGEQLIAKGAEWSLVGHAMVLMLPQALSTTIPMAVLLGTLIGLGRISGDREFVAMQACGVSLTRLMRPIGVVAVLSTAATAYVTIVALPDANQTFREIVFSVVATRVEQKVGPGVFFEDFPGRTIYVRNLPPEGGWEDVLLADTKTPGQTTVYLARRGRINIDRERQLVQLELQDVTYHTTYQAAPAQYEQTSVDRIGIMLDPSTVFKDPPARGPAEMSLGQLRRLINEQAHIPGATTQNRFMFQLKLSLPATCPILALIALALGASSRRDGKLASFVVGFAVILVYYILLYGSRAMAMGGSLHPEWAPWVPNIAMAVVAVVLTAWRARAADQPIRLSVPAFWRRAAPPAGRVARGTAAAKPRVIIVIRIPRFDIPMPRLLDLYVSREYLRVAVLGVGSLLGIFYIATFIDIADELFRGEASTALLLRYFFFQTPQFVYYVTPMALMVATLVTIGALTKNSELLVMRACGISLYRTAAPILIFALLGSGFLFLLQERVLAGANRQADRLNRTIRGLAPPGTVADRQWLLGHDGAVYHYGFFDPDLKHFSRLQIYRVDDQTWRLRAMTQASEARWVSSSGEAGGVWSARDGWIRQFGPAPAGGGAAPRYSTFDEREIGLEPPSYFTVDEPLIADMPLATQMTYEQLERHIDRLRASGAHVAPYVVELRRKVSFPFVTVIITMLAVPFAVTTGRRGAMYGIGIGIVLAIVYWITLSIFGALGSRDVLTPWLAAWAPNVLFGAGAAYMILTVRT